MKNNDLDIQGYIKLDNKYYKYNYEIDGVYYCYNNIIIDNNEVKKYDKEKYIVMDYFIIDLINKRIVTYDKYIKDSFPEIFNIEKISITKIKKENKMFREVEIVSFDKKITRLTLDNNNNLIKIDSNITCDIPNNFLIRNKYLQEINLFNVKNVGDYFLYTNTDLSLVNIPRVENIGISFLCCNRNVKSVNFLHAKNIHNYFFNYNTEIEVVNLPNVEKIYAGFLHNDKKLKVLNVKDYIYDYYKDKFPLLNDYQNQKVLAKKVLKY